MKLPPAAVQTGNALAQGDLQNMGYRYDASIRRAMPTDSVVGGFQQRYGEVGPGIPQTHAQMKHGEKTGYYGGPHGPGRTENQQRLQAIINDFISEHGEATTMAMLEELRYQAGKHMGPGVTHRATQPKHDSKPYPSGRMVNNGSFQSSEPQRPYREGHEFIRQGLKHQAKIR